ncbi:hypothetical protein R9C00_04490 [Flammeovirgaceae bacterium SG7u.111]|nr:hypothetical protein [Flammeovirgaceae bacterium SG7u.132]WPO36705.1 hypothetical protein R9C00_04490 [Flammeovirgaceae bacterium SG7u.111]
MKIRSVLELTPLLDIFLLLLFAFIVNKKQTGSKELAIAQQTADSLQQVIAEFSTDLDSSQQRALNYEKQLKEQRELLASSLKTVSEKLGEFLGTKTEEVRKKAEENLLSMDDYDQFAQNIESLELSDPNNLIQKVYMLKELQAITSIVSIYLGDNNEIFIDGAPTSISLQDLDEQTGSFPTEAVEGFKYQLKARLEETYLDRKTSEMKLGDVVLFTFGHSDQSMRGAISAGKAAVHDFYRDIELRENNARKVFYADLGFYPFEPSGDEFGE